MATLRSPAADSWMRKTVQKRTVPRRRLWLFSGFALLLIALQILHLPENLNFTAFAFGEPGGNLSVVYMVRHGMHPNVDFGHPYGLLGLLFSDIWFRITGLTPAAYWAGILVIELAMCAVLTRSEERRVGKECR